MIAERPGPRATPCRLLAGVAFAVIAVALVAIAPAARAASTGHIYWVEDSSGALGRAELAGTNVVNPFIGIYSNPGRVAVDTDHIG